MKTRMAANKRVIRMVEWLKGLVIQYDECSHLSDPENLFPVAVRVMKLMPIVFVHMFQIR